MTPAGRTAIVAVDRAGAITHWDDGAEWLFGHRREHAVGRSVDLIVPERYRDAHWAAFHPAVDAGASKLHDQATTLATRHADGGERLLPARFVFLLDPRGAAAGALAIFAEPGGKEFEWQPPAPWGDA